MFGINKRTSRKSAKGKPAEIRLPAGLTKREQKQVKEIIERARKDDGVPRTAQQSIPFQRMFPDGICRVSDNYYTKTIYEEDVRDLKERFDEFWRIGKELLTRLSTIW